MSFDGSVEIVWAGDRRTFRLAIENLIALQNKLIMYEPKGPMGILLRLQSGGWLIEDLQETIRIGLIGAGVESKAAQALVDANVREGRLTANVLIAQAILMNALAGDPDDPVGKDEATTETPGVTTTSPPPPYTGTARRSASRRKKRAK